MGQIVDSPNPLIWYNGHMRSPQYKAGDVVRYIEQAREIEPRPMIILEVQAALTHTKTIRYRVLIGDEQWDDLFEHWIEPV